MKSIKSKFLKAEKKLLLINKHRITIKTTKYHKTVINEVFSSGSITHQIPKKIETNVIDM